jgi:soluble lytic murein transglycosylase-like protein
MSLLSNFFKAFEPQKPITQPSNITEETRRPYPQFNAFRPFVIDELVRRKNQFPTATKAPFVRFTSCKQDAQSQKQKYAFFTLGLHGFKNEDLNIFDVTYGGKQDIVGYAYELGTGQKKLIAADNLTMAAIPKPVTTELGEAVTQTVQKQRDLLKAESSKLFALGTHPIPGVTNIHLQRRGLGTPLIATVQWTCYNRAQLEFLRHHFMTAGGYVVLEWGQNFSDKSVNKILDFTDINSIKTELANCITEGRKRIIDHWIKPNNGNYDLMVGFIGQFTVDFDPETNIYNCSTTVYSVGEQMWGLSSFLTVVNKEDPNASKSTRKPTSFHEFFEYEQTFDQLINQSASNNKYVAPYRASWDKGGTANVATPNGFNANGQDYRFVSWNFLVEVIIPEMLSIFDDENIKNDLKKFLDFKQGNEDVWVGDNPQLKSTNPDVMVIVRSTLTTNTAFAGIGNFDDDPAGGGYRGKLGRGVWLNAAVIREAFRGTNNFQQAMMTLLLRINDATSNYWKLMMFYDEETTTYRIVDEGHTDNRNFPILYKFNHGAKGELLNITFDSAFPPELISQMALFAKFKTQSPEKQQQLLRDYPSIGTTSTFMFSLNWTNLEDILDTELQRRRDTSTTSPVVSPVQIVTNTTGKNADTLSAAARLVPVSTTNQGAFTTVTTLQAGNPFNQTQPPPTMLVRNGVSAVPNKTAITLYQKMLPFKHIIDSTGAKYGIDPDLIRAVIARENPGLELTATREEPHINDRSVGLMQLLTKTASSVAGRQVESWELARPDTNIDLGTKYLADNIRAHNGDVEAGVSAYNNGSGKRAQKDTFGYVIQHKPEVKIDVPAGKFFNYPYVDSVMKKYEMFKSLSGTTSTPVATPQAQPTPTPVPTTPVMVAPTGQQYVAQPPTADDEAQKKHKDEIAGRFGDVIVNYIELSPSSMVGRITRDGHEKYPHVPNSFVCPFPTTTAITLETVGIGGISVSDGFFVDKLPYIFEQYGCFQVTAVDEVVSPDGWKTRISGYFKLVWMNGEGPLPIPVG